MCHPKLAFFCLSWFLLGPVSLNLFTQPGIPQKNSETALPPGAIARFAPVEFPNPRPMWVSFLPDGKTLATLATSSANIAPEPKLIFWEAKTGKKIRCLEGHFQVVFSPDGKIMASRKGPKEKVIRILNLESGKEIGRVQVFCKDKYPMVVFCFSPDGKFLAVSGGTHNTLGPNNPPLWLWKVTSSKKVRSFPVNQFLNCLIFSSDGKFLATAEMYNNQVQIWDVAKGTLVRQFQKPQLNSTAICFSPDGNYLGFAGVVPPVLIWNLPKNLEKWRIHVLDNGGALSLAFSPNGQTLAVGTYTQNYKGTVYLLEAATGKERWRFQGPKKGVWSLSFSPDGLLLASACEAVFVWDVTGKIQNGGKANGPLEAKVLTAHWASLAGKDAAKAWQAICALVNHPEQAIFLLKEKFPPIRKLDPKRLAKLSADLGSEDFADRERASAEIRKLGQAAAPLLRKLLFSRPSTELKLRVKWLLEEGGVLQEEVRCGRTVEILEYIGTPEARKALEDHAKGEPGCRLTEEAKAALKRFRNHGF